MLEVLRLSWYATRRLQYQAAVLFFASVGFSLYEKFGFFVFLVWAFRQTVYPIFIVHEHIRLGWLRTVGAKSGAGRGGGFAREGKGALSSIS